MKRNCPTISELLAFDAVAQHGSLTRAAGVLCISVSAVSKQLAGLENFIGRPLLRKHGRGIQLTPAGREFWLRISPCLRKIESATFEARADVDDAGVLTLASVPTFLTKWLIPRLAGFRRRHPDVTFSFTQHIGQDEAFPLEIDAAIRYGDGQWPGVISDYVAGHAFSCIYSPALLEGRAPLESPQDLLECTILHHEQAPQAWRSWAACHGVDEIQILAGPRFAQYSAIIQAVLSGLGVGIVPNVLIEQELREGRVLAFGRPVDGGQGHYLCFRQERLERPVFTAFRAWLLAEGRLSGGAGDTARLAR